VLNFCDLSGSSAIIFSSSIICVN